jgi:hypothetical protein
MTRRRKLVIAGLCGGLLLASAAAFFLLRRSCPTIETDAYRRIISGMTEADVERAVGARHCNYADQDVRRLVRDAELLSQPDPDTPPRDPLPGQTHRIWPTKDGGYLVVVFDPSGKVGDPDTGSVLPIHFQPDRPRNWLEKVQRWLGL